MPTIIQSNKNHSTSGSVSVSLSGCSSVNTLLLFGWAAYGPSSPTILIPSGWTDRGIYFYTASSSYFTMRVFSITGVTSSSPSVATGGFNCAAHIIELDTEPDWGSIVRKNSTSWSSSLQFGPIVSSSGNLIIGCGGVAYNVNSDTNIGTPSDSFSEIQKSRWNGQESGDSMCMVQTISKTSTGSSESPYSSHTDSFTNGISLILSVPSSSISISKVRRRFPRGLNRA